VPVLLLSLEDLEFPLEVTFSSSLALSTCMALFERCEKLRKSWLARMVLSSGLSPFKSGPSSWLLCGRHQARSEPIL
jgi:hypothetical protein